MWKPGRRSLLILAGGIVLALVAGLLLRARQSGPRYMTAVVDRGSIVESVGATGTLQAVTTVQVGSQVSGIIQSLNADFNSVVHKDQVVARLDPSLFQARVAQARANLAAARANAERARADLADAQQKYKRASELSAQDLLPQADLESAKAAADSAVAQVKSASAAVTQAEANLNQAGVDLQHTVISAPISGVVIARNVDVGQTVAASFQAPTLFVIANDLSHMQVNASVDEADIGRVRTGQEVTFRVDAYPERTFTGWVEQIRLQPVTAQNVVTYNTIVSVENPRQLLLPGMTATVSIIANRADDALRLPVAALRFRPEGVTTSRTPSGGAERTADASTSRGTGEGARDTRRPGRRDAGAGSPGRGPREGDAATPGGSSGGSSEKDKDAERPRGRRAEVYVLGASAAPERRSVVLGVSDGQYIEVRSGLDEGGVVITGTDGLLNGGAANRAQAATNPFAPRRPERRQR